MKSLKRWLDRGHATLETTICKVIIMWMGCLEDDRNTDGPMEVRSITIL